MPYPLPATKVEGIVLRCKLLAKTGRLLPVNLKQLEAGKVWNKKWTNDHIIKLCEEAKLELAQQTTMLQLAPDKVPNHIVSRWLLVGWPILSCACPAPRQEICFVSNGAHAKVALRPSDLARAHTFSVSLERARFKLRALSQAAIQPKKGYFAAITMLKQTLTFNGMMYKIIMLLVITH